jgi:hypothetical protein
MIEAVLSTILFTSLIWIAYHHVGYDNLKHCYSHWFKDGYWTNYNIVEAVAWLAKALVIVPALLWGQEIWQLHIITLATSAALIWVSERKLLPTLVAFNTLWIVISSIVIVKNLI